MDFDDVRPLLGELRQNRGWLTATFRCPEQEFVVESSARLEGHQTPEEARQAAKHRAVGVGGFAALVALGPAVRLANVAVRGATGKSVTKQIRDELRIQEPQTQRAVVDAFEAVEPLFELVRSCRFRAKAQQGWDDDAEPFEVQRLRTPVAAASDRALYARLLGALLGRGPRVETGHLVAESLLDERFGPARVGVASELPTRRDLRTVRWAARETMWMGAAALVELMRDFIFEQAWQADAAAPEAILDELGKDLQVGWPARKKLHSHARGFVVRGIVEDELDQRGADGSCGLGGEDQLAVTRLAVARGERLGLHALFSEGVAARALRSRGVRR